MGEADRVLLITEDSRREGTPTGGMRREEAIATDATWGGLAVTDAGMRSDWHHHGEYESVIYVLSGRLVMESGPGGADVVEASPGDFLFVPRGAIHREANPGSTDGVAVVVRSGRGVAVVNVDGPAASG